jgi:membrane fusion protein, heavy metal efflux system
MHPFHSFNREQAQQSARISIAISRDYLSIQLFQSFCTHRGVPTKRWFRQENTVNVIKNGLFPTLGTWLRILCVCVLMAVGCSEPNKGGESPVKPASSDHLDEPKHEGLPTKIRLEPHVIQDAGIVTQAVVREALLPTVSLPGEVVINPDHTSQVSAPMAGGRLVKVLVQEGSQVKKGDIIAVLRVPDLGKVRGALASTRAKLVSAQAHERRLQKLFKLGLTPEQQYMDAKAEALSLRAQKRALSGELAAVGAGHSQGKAFDLALRAPQSGIVVMRNALVGQPVASDQILAQLANLDEVWFLARVFEKDLHKLQANVPADVELNAYPNERFPGRLEYIGKQIDPVGRTVTARIVLTNSKGKLRLGLFGMATIALANKTSKQKSLVVPRSALVDVAGKTSVFVRQPDGDFELHEVVLGRSGMGKVAIVSGLREQEQVVTSGVFTLKSVVLKGSIADED